MSRRQGLSRRATNVFAEHPTELAELAANHAAQQEEDKSDYESEITEHLVRVRAPATVYPPRTTRLRGVSSFSRARAVDQGALCSYTPLLGTHLPVAAHPFYPFSGSEHTHLHATSLTF